VTILLGVILTTFTVTSSAIGADAMGENPNID